MRKLLVVALCLIFVNPGLSLRADEPPTYKVMKYATFPETIDQWETVEKKGSAKFPAPDSTTHHKRWLPFAGNVRTGEFQEESGPLLKKHSPTEEKTRAEAAKLPLEKDGTFEVYDITGINTKLSALERKLTTLSESHKNAAITKAGEDAKSNIDAALSSSKTYTDEQIKLIINALAGGDKKNAAAVDALINKAIDAKLRVVEERYEEKLRQLEQKIAVLEGKGK